MPNLLKHQREQVEQDRMPSTLLPGKFWKQNCAKPKAMRAKPVLERILELGWQSFSERVNLLLLPVFRLPFWMWHLTSRNLVAELLMTPILGLRGVLGAPTGKKLTELLMGCELRISLNLSHVRSGNPSSKIDMSTLKSYSRQWNLVTIPTMMQRTLQPVLPLSKRRMSLLNALSTPNLNGTGFLPHGKMGSLCYILTEKQSCEAISRLSATSFVQLLETRMRQLISMPRSENVMSKAHIVSMIATRFSYPFSRKCFKLVLGLVLVNGAWALFPHPQVLHQKGPLLFVRTGTLGSVTTRVLIGASMAPVLNVEINTEPKTSNHALPLSTLNVEKDLVEDLGKEVEKAAAGPRTFSFPALKQSAEDVLEGPRFRRGYLWSSTPVNSLSPAALSTESAPPLPSPPSHLLNDPIIQKTLDSLQGYIKVDTPFNIDRLETLLYDHPNQPFVKSVIRGLREGFWPFDEGDWKIEQGEIIKNATDEALDLQAMRVYRDREIEIGRWSSGLPFSSLLPGMKMSPMFVAWQKNKPRVITDHSASGLNDGIPKAEGQVKYDDMHPFGQTLYEWLQHNPDR
jgi:hypothetical protein